MDLPILPPHLLTMWLRKAGLLVFNREAAIEFWAHHRSVGTPWMRTMQQDDCFQPFALYGDEAEYTKTKEKLLVIFASYLSKCAKQSCHVILKLDR